MRCASCVARLEQALAKVPGVAEVAVNLATESVRIQWEQHAAANAPTSATSPVELADNAKQPMPVAPP